MRSTKAIAVLAGTFMVAITQVLASPAPIPGYSIVPINWNIPNGTEGSFIQLQGTIQEVDAQLARDHPHIKRDLVFGNVTDDDISVAAVSGPRGTPSQDWRAHAWCPEPGCCGYANWKRANAYYILNGIDYLNGFKHEIGIDGPNACGRVSCSYNSAIYWCNDNRNYLFWKNGKALAGGAHKALANCLYKAESVLAQLFSDKNDKGELSINVILRADSC